MDGTTSKSEAHGHDKPTDGADTIPKGDEYRASRPGKVRLKSTHSSSRRSRDKKRSREEDDPHEHGRHRHHHHRHRRRRHHKDPEPEPEEYRSPPVSPNTAFRESLFDALADDEGADYWQAVYGQPIHTYARPDERGELEKMTDDEYAAYVRARMWEKTHQGLIEERERRRKVREAEREQARGYGRYSARAETEREAFDRIVEESLKRGKERKTRKEQVNIWLDIWKRYLDCWENLNNRAQEGQASSSPADSLRNIIVWPVESGKRKDVKMDSVKQFVSNAPVPNGGSEPEHSSSRTSRHSNMLAVLKLERVRWHPDKIRHRYGVLGVDDDMVKAATEVFQILDRIWVEEQAK
ncbi:hypothetical protein MGYG_02443 [Nannizzia gypsea CBS 118893]|uniref:Uncharacterized protein n=1 Tax=Arthroderma gypseum (strain ATCC MYA-4604 / CBS 118893) TaxID=535722 RepID=E4UML4_ARTGP|nr:hypothetical protein MGYG_02443 [Nannizzia gypsea CBS 118893]EFQ99431.1 hypothetical protein MGYG_02443 [Nannizzia gypsea CBS 118893]